MNKIYKIWTVFLLVFVLVGCAHVVPVEIRKTVDSSVDPEKLFKAPEAYEGKKVMLGGEIIEVRNLKDVTYMEVLERPLGQNGIPQYQELSRGRFMIKYKGFLDPAVYKKGRLVTVVGVLSGTMKGKIGQMEYKYPLIVSENLYLVKPYQGPTIGIGIGFGFFHD